MKIKPYPQNAKKHPDKQLKQIAASIERFGFRQPIVIDKDGTIIVGHGRYEAATKILEWTELKEASEAKKGEKLIPYIIADDLTEDEIKAYRLADNKLNESGWDMGIVELELKELDTELAKLTGFDITGEVQEDSFDAGSVAENIHNVEQGDVYELGEHRLMCGDSTKMEDMEKLMNGEVVDLVFTDPPYGVNFQSNGRVKSKKFDVLLNDDTILTDWIAPALALSKGWFLFCTSWKVLGQWLDAGKLIGDLSNMIIWDKGGGGIGDLTHTLATDYEIILAYNRGNKILSRIGSVWTVGKDHATGYVHPTQKPVALPAMAIENLSTGSVLDSFGGSGSTLMACEQLKRKCYTMELDPHYCSVIIERWQQFTNKKAIKL